MTCSLLGAVVTSAGAIAAWPWPEPRSMARGGPVGAAGQRLEQRRQQALGRDVDRHPGVSPRCRPRRCRRNYRQGRRRAPARRVARSPTCRRAPAGLPAPQPRCRATSPLRSMRPELNPGRRRNRTGSTGSSSHGRSHARSGSPARWRDRHWRSSPSVAPAWRRRPADRRFRCRAVELPVSDEIKCRSKSSKLR